MIAGHYADQSTGSYIGWFDDGAILPSGAIAVSQPPHGGAFWQDGKWVDHQSQELALAAAKRGAGTAMVGWIAAFLSQFTAGVPDDEVKSWSRKADAARAHLAGTAQPMILAEAAITGENPDALAAKIVAKADAFELIMASVTGLRRVTEAAISAATTPEEVSAALAAAQKTALSLAAQMGLPQPKDMSNA